MFKSNFKRNKKSIKNNFLKCDCDKNTSTYHVAPAGCADDDAAVAALPYQWTPRRSGPVLANYLIKRKQDHDKTLQDVYNSAKVVNDRVDSKIRALAENLLAQIQYNNNQMSCVVQKYKTEDTVIVKNLRDDALKEIYRLYSNRINEMNDFRREASVIERERANGLRIVLREQFQNLIKIGHLAPKDLLHDFDGRVYEINQQLLSNTRAYIDLEAQLRVQADESVGHARSAINQLCFGSNTRERVQSAVVPVTQERRNIQRPVTTICDKKSETSVLSAFSTLDEVETTDTANTRLVQAYKASVSRVFNKFGTILFDLEKDLEAKRNFNDLVEHSCREIDFHQIIEKAVKHLSNSIYKKKISNPELLEITAADIKVMQKSLWSLGECFQDTFNVLHDAGHLWDSHILRQALVQKLTIAAVEDLFTSNDTIEMMNEVSFNTSLELLRGSSDPDKLQAEYKNVMDLLHKTADMYRIHSEAELCRLEEFMKSPPALTNVLLSEFRCFLNKHPRITRTSQSLNYNKSKQDQSCSAGASFEFLLSPLPRAILQTELQELALHNWKNGFLESFERNVSLVPEELQRQARYWVEERANVLHMRFSFKMVSHSIRIERVNAARDARLLELNHHEARLASHLDAISQLIECLPRDALKFPASDLVSLYPFNGWIDRIQENMDKLINATEPLNHETIQLKMCSYEHRMLKHRKSYEVSINAAIDEYKKMVENRIQNARISTVRLFSQITLFSEGGEYSAQEAVRACGALVKRSEVLETCIGKVMDALHNRRHYLLAQADERLHSLRNICGDLLGKGKGWSQKKK